MKKIYKAWYDSRNFSFEAYSTNERKAKAILIRGLRKHGQQYNCDPRWWYRDDECVMEFKLNEPYRDHDTI